MKTNIGKALLKHYSQQKINCYEQMAEISKEMKTWQMSDFSTHEESYCQVLLQRFKKLQSDSEKHQQEIDTMIAIENMSSFEEEISPKARRAEIALIKTKIAALEAGELSELGEQRLAELKEELQKVMNA